MRHIYHYSNDQRTINYYKPKLHYSPQCHSEHKADGIFLRRLPYGTMKVTWVTGPIRLIVSWVDYLKEEYNTKLNYVCTESKHISVIECWSWFWDISWMSLLCKANVLKVMTVSVGNNDVQLILFSLRGPKWGLGYRRENHCLLVCIEQLRPKVYC